MEQLDTQMFFQSGYPATDRRFGQAEQLAGLGQALQHLAGTWGQGAVRLDAIAEAQNIPRKFLTVILSEMAREGIVVSHRGRDGGYELALPPVDIRYGDIIRLTRGSLALVPCASRNAHETCNNCLPEAECRLRGLMLLLRLPRRRRRPTAATAVHRAVPVGRRRAPATRSSCCACPTACCIAWSRHGGHEP